MATDLPCNGDGICMVCNATPPPTETLTCAICVTPWHAPCLSSPPSMADAVSWNCPDCSAPLDAPAAPAAPVDGQRSDLVAAIRAIEADSTLSEVEKARRRQKLMGGGNVSEEEDEEKNKKGRKGSDVDMLGLLDEKFNCAICMQLPERPVTTPCGHNFCLKCFQKWVGQSKYTCAKCRSAIPSKMASQPRINSALVAAIRMAKTSKSASSGSSTVYHFIRNENRPEKAFTTERAKKTGKANACSGQIFVTIPPDHFGPISADYDPRRNMGVLVGETWEDRMECRQWGAHFPHVAGIAGQSDYGAQSVALSGGYVDDEDHGEWFLYTGSGGRDLSGNKRTNKDQSFDQKFDKSNQALRVSCLKGYPVRVVRSHKEKRSSYAPETGVRYDGVYRIEKCWRKVGIQGHKVCRYLFVRCDNEPAPWTSDEHGDRPRPLPVIKELKDATDVTERKGSPAWDYEDDKGWKWTVSPPVSRKPVSSGNFDEKKPARKIRAAQSIYVRERLLKEFGCTICRKVMNLPLTTPCGHNFCKPCLVESFADKSFVRERGTSGGRTLRTQKIVKKCPACPTDISDFLQNPQVNRELNDLIETLQQELQEKEQQEILDASGEVDQSNDENTEEKEQQEILDASGEVDQSNDENTEKDFKNSVQSAEVMKLSEEESDISENKHDGENGDDITLPKKRKNSTGGKRGAKKAKTKTADVQDEASHSDVSVDEDCATDNVKKPTRNAVKNGNEAVAEDEIVAS